jgi:hypothetical protein
MAEYEVVADFWWGSGHCFEERFTVSKKSQIPGILRSHMLSFTRRYTFDCGNLNQPLHPRLGAVTVKKIEQTHYLNKERFHLDEFMELEAEQTRQLIESKTIYVNGSYNRTPHKKHRRIMRWKPT